ncbi:hypothetical protein [Promicromonospora umidemergens]|uniref:hypothetical protein n=1 Tax=Promicromonospora umidemergens TaxID=629679 RepID=UPI0020A5E66A|nr:hypothetical protein [Promicromonospora umidemergens]
MQWSDNGMKCEVTADDPGSGGGDGDTGGDASGGSGNDDGSDGGGDLRITVDGQSCLYIGLADPQPPRDRPVWEGNEDGAIHTALCGANQRFGPTVEAEFWAPDAPEAPPTPDPAELAEQARAQMNLRAIDIGIVPEDEPGSIGIVGMPQWMWVVDPGRHTMGPITETATAGNFSVTATARVDKIVWNMGDGTTVTCVGSGTPYEDKYDIADSPDCGHRYTRQGEYKVTATSYWILQWQGIGDTGTIEFTLEDSTDIVMGEAQVITQ